MRKILAGSLFVSLVFSGGLSKTEKKIQEYVDKHSEEAIDLIEKVVNINSGTLNIDGNRTVGKIFQAELDQLGFNTYWVPILRISNVPGIFLRKCGAEREKGSF